jgi:uncharacterized protein YaaR (DUF327 family)
MGISRKNALKRLRGLAPRILQHLEYLADDPESQDVSHWKHEIRNWITQMEEVLHAVGEKTGAQWREQINTWIARLEE